MSCGSWKGRKWEKKKKPSNALKGANENKTAQLVWNCPPHTLHFGLQMTAFDTAAV